MPVKRLKPTSPKLRFATKVDSSDITRKHPHKSLTFGLKYKAGRNSSGRADDLRRLARQIKRLQKQINLLADMASAMTDDTPVVARNFKPLTLKVNNRKIKIG